MVRLDHAHNSWYDILDYLMKRPINKSIWSILQRLLLGASVNILWQERNLRTFQNRRSLENVCNLIKDVVRRRVLSLSLKHLCYHILAKLCFYFLRRVSAYFYCYRNE